MKQAVVVDAVRTPMGRSKGACSATCARRSVRGGDQRAPPPQPGAEPREIDDIVWGCVQQTLEQAFNVARFAQLRTPIPKEVSAQTVNRLCGSSMTALTRRRCVDHGRLRRPVPRRRRRAHGPPADDARYRLQPGSTSGPRRPRAHGHDRRVPGAHARRRAASRTSSRCARTRGPTGDVSGAFRDEIVPVEGHDETGALRAATRRGHPPRHDARGALGPEAAFDPKGGTTTAGNASAVSDGAAGSS